MNEEWQFRLSEAKRNKQWPEVEFWANEGLKSAPTSTYLYETLGEAVEKQDRVDEAIQYYEKCLAIGLAGKDRPRSKCFKRLDVLYRRLQQYGDSFRVCEYYVEQYGTADAWNRLKRGAKKLGFDEISEEAEEEVQRLNTKFVPRGADEPGTTIPDVVEITEEDIEQATKSWDKMFPEYAGLLNAEVINQKSEEEEDSK
jgi:tetratricopeptide (TPR) repeat protein